jgi:hypothetical protein
MEYLIYISTAKKLLSEQELTDILTVSRDNNERHNITGALLYSEGTFIQLLEGDTETIEKAFAAISKDERHKNIIKLGGGAITKRSFPDWTMAFRTLNTMQLESIAGYLNLTEANFDTEDEHPGISMMKTFIATN